MPEKERNTPLLLAGGLLVLAGMGTITAFFILAGRFPPFGVLWLPTHMSSDRDPETRKILSKMSTITSTRITLNWCTIGAELVALGLVFVTRRGRESLTEQ